MNDIRPPAPGATTTIELSGFPVRLWWKLLETAQLKGVSVNYLVLSILAQAVDHNDYGESYDLVVQEISQHLKDQ
ncbi:MAG: hypothetical protein ACOZHQ_00060 [Thermodesulfobacteriota bacterium]